MCINPNKTSDAELLKELASIFSVNVVYYENAIDSPSKYYPTSAEFMDPIVIKKIKGGISILYTKEQTSYIASKDKKISKHLKRDDENEQKIDCITNNESRADNILSDLVNANIKLIGGLLNLANKNNTEEFSEAIEELMNLELFNRDFNKYPFCKMKSN